MTSREKDNFYPKIELPRIGRRFSIGFLECKLSDNLCEIIRSFSQAGLVVMLLYIVDLHDAILFRVLVEFFSAVVSFGIFIVAWNSRKITNNNFLIFIGLAYLFIGLIGAIRTFVYPGLAISTSISVDISQQLRLAGLYLESGSFFIALVYLDRRRIATRIAFLAYLIIFLFIFSSIFLWNIFPSAYVVGAGQTGFKTSSDVSVILILVLSAIVIMRKKERLDPLVRHFFILMLAFQILAVAFHEPFMNAYSLANFVSQSFRFVAFFFLYKAVIKTGLMQPYNLLFRSLKDRERALERYRDRLESMVSERTAELEKSNSELQQEISNRQVVENNLLESYSHLGMINRRISLLLDLNKHSYKKKKRETSDYILNCAINLSRASMGALYFRSGQGFCLALSKGIGPKKLQDIKFINPNSYVLFKDMLAEKRLIRGLSQDHDLGSLAQGGEIEYFIALPFLINWKIRGFIFLGFKDKKSMDQQEVEFLDVFSNNAALAMFNAEILK